jgi:hypothetical protein
MSDAASGSIDVGHPDRNGDNWQFGIRPAESLDAARMEIVSTPEPFAAPNPTKPRED